MNVRVILLSFTVAAAALAPASAQYFRPANGQVDEAAHALDRKDWDLGTRLVREALRSGDLVAENYPAAYNNLCIGLTGLHQFTDAMEACTKALQLRPRQWESYNNRANIYFFLGQYDQALAEYYKAMTFRPNDDILLKNVTLTLGTKRFFGNKPGAEKNT